jgi:hypothetical protein
MTEGNCGQELSPDTQFCPNCGRPAHETARVSTPEADVVGVPTAGAGQIGASQVGRSLAIEFLAVVPVLIVIIALYAYGRLLNDPRISSAEVVGGH